MAIQTDFGRIDYSPLDYTANRIKDAELQSLNDANQLHQMGLQDKQRSASLAQMRKQVISGSGGDLSLAQMHLTKLGDVQGAGFLQEHIQKGGKYTQDTDTHNQNIEKGNVDLNKKYNENNVQYLEALIGSPTEENFKRVEADAIRTKNPTALAFFGDVAMHIERGGSYASIVPTMTNIRRSLLSQEDKKERYEDAGDNRVQTNRDSNNPNIPVNMSPYQQGSQKVAEGNLDVNRRRLASDEREAAFNRLKESPTSVKNQQKLNEEVTSIENSITTLDKMKMLVTESPRSTASMGSPVARLYEGFKAMFDPDAKDTKDANGVTVSHAPAIKFIQLRDLFLATAVKLNVSGRMSNQDRERIENALGGEWLTTPENTKESLRLVKEIMNSYLHFDDKSGASSGNKSGASSGNKGDWKDI